MKNKLSKLYSLLIVVTLILAISSSFIGLSLSAIEDEELIYSNTTGTSHVIELEDNHPSDEQFYDSAASGNILLNQTWLITNVTVDLQRDNSPTGDVCIQIFPCNASDIPEGNALATSEYIDITTISDSAKESVTFSFNETNQLRTNSTTYYAFAIVAPTSGTCDATNSILVYHTTGDAITPSTTSVYTRNNWHSGYTTYDINLEIYGVSTSGVIDNWWHPFWKYRYLVTLNNSLSTEDLGNFTVRVHLDDTNFNFSLANGQGDDLRFIDIDASTQLTAQKESFYSIEGNDFPDLSSWTDFSLATAGWRENPHTWSMMETNYLGTYKYWSYIYSWSGSTHGIGLVRSNSTTSGWTWYSADRMISDVERPAILRISDSEFYMYVHNMTTYNLDRWSSPDGVTWAWDEVTINPSDRDRASNPSIKKFDSTYYLYYSAFDYSGGSSDQSIRVRSAVLLDDLSTDEPTELLNYTDLYAIQFPSVEYFNNRYWMVVEGIPSEVAGRWVLYAYYSDTPDGIFTEGDNNELVPYIEACPFMWMNDDNVSITLYDTQQDTNWDVGCRTFTVNTNEAHLWVRVPQIDSESESDGFYIYFGNPDAESVWDTVNAWDDDYVAVYHFSEQEAGTIHDSARGYDNTLQTTAEPYVIFDTEGIIDGAIYADGALGAITSEDHNELDCTGDWTVWSLSNTADENEETGLIVKKYNTSPTYPLYSLGLEDNTGYPKWYIRYTTFSIGIAEVDCFDKWTMIAGVRNTTADTIMIYVNGTMSNSTEDLSGQADLSNNGKLGILCGYYSGASVMRSHGIMDEARIYDGVLSAEWLEAENLNLFGDWFWISALQDILDYTSRIDISEPEDEYVAHSYTVEFKFTPIFYYSDPVTAYFHTNSTAWSIRNLIGDVVNNTESSYDFTFFEQGQTYSWGIEIIDDYNQSIWSDNRTLTIGSIDFLDQYNYPSTPNILPIDENNIFCQRFKPSLEVQSRVKVNASVYSTTEDFVIEIRTDTSGIPDLSESGLITNTSLAYTQFESYTSFDYVGWDYTDFNNTDTYYWVVLKAPLVTGSDHYFVSVDIDDGYADGYAYRSTNGGTSYFTEYAYDLEFEIYGYDYVTAEDVPDSRPYIPDTRYDDATILTLWGRSDTWTKYDEYACKLYTDTIGSTSTYTEITSENLHNFTVSLRLYRVDNDGKEEIATEIAGVTKTSTGIELIDTTYETENILWNINDALMIEVLFSLDNSDPVIKGKFITDSIKTDLILSANWTVYYSLNITNLGDSYSYACIWGTQTIDPASMFRIGNFAYANLDPWGLGFYELGAGNFFNFIMNPFTFYLGDLFYGLLLMGFLIPAYNRYRSLQPVMILCFIFGGVGGVMTALIPQVAIPISFVFIVIGATIALYKLVRS